MATKFNNKKNVVLKLALNTVVTISLILFLSTIFYFNILTIFPKKKLGYLLIIIALAYLIYVLYKSKVLDYDSTSEVLSIKYYLPTESDISRPNDVFELPKSNIISYKIQTDFFHKYLVIRFENSNGICMKKYFDITTCTKSQISKLKLESNDMNRKYKL